MSHMGSENRASMTVVDRGPVGADTFGNVIGASKLHAQRSRVIERNDVGYVF